MNLFYRFLALTIALLIITLPAFADTEGSTPADPNRSAIGVNSPRHVIPDRDDTDEDIWTEDFEGFSLGEPVHVACAGGQGVLQNALDELVGLLAFV